MQLEAGDALEKGGNVLIQSGEGSNLSGNITLKSADGTSSGKILIGTGDSALSSSGGVTIGNMGEKVKSIRILI